MTTREDRKPGSWEDRAAACGQNHDIKNVVFAGSQRPGRRHDSGTTSPRPASTRPRRRSAQWSINRPETPARHPGTAGRHQRHRGARGSQSRRTPAAHGRLFTPTCCHERSLSWQQPSRRSGVLLAPLANEETATGNCGQQGDQRETLHCVPPRCERGAIQNIPTPTAAHGASAPCGTQAEPPWAASRAEDRLSAEPEHAMTRAAPTVGGFGCHPSYGAIF